MNRIDRVTAILIQLQSKRIVKAQEIADRFNISLRTVYRDIRTLDEAGIPIIGEAGVGYSIVDGYRLPPVMFTKEEATTFLMAEKIIEKYTDTYNLELYQSALFKIKAVLRTAEKEFLDDISDNIVVLKNNYQPEEQHNNQALQAILTSINEKKALHITYAAAYAENITERHVEPLGIYLQSNLWYLIAYCQLRKDYRNFRTDRINHFRITEKKYSNDHPSLEEYLQKMSRESDMQTVVIRVEKRLAKYLAIQKYYYGFVAEEEKEGKIEMTFLSCSMDGFARWYLMFGAEAQIIQPETVKIRVKELVAEIASKL